MPPASFVAGTGDYRFKSDPLTNDHLIGFVLILAQRYDIGKAVLGNVEIVAVRIGTTRFCVWTAIGPRLWQFVGTNLLQSVDDLFTALNFETKMIKTVRRLLLVIR